MTRRPLRPDHPPHGPSRRLPAQAPRSAHYRLFLSKIGNGGQLGVMRYMTLDEVLARNTASVWALPLPAELRDIVNDEDTQAQVEGDVLDEWPGLLRVTHASYSRQTYFLTRDFSRCDAR